MNTKNSDSINRGKIKKVIITVLKITIVRVVTLKTYRKISNSTPGDYIISQLFKKF